MQRSARRVIARCVASAALPLILLGSFAADVRSNPFAPELRWPLGLPTPRITGGFGETRSGRFHAGLDLSTGARTGAVVRAPADCRVERVRSSGSGYGRSLYLRTDDGRLVVFGHLDAFAPELAAYVDSAQRATAEYEQDLWPPAGRFRFAAGERVAWSGQSGAGPPHLHVEVRHGDFAMQPLLWGYAVPDTVPPRLEAVLLEPLDENTWVEGGAGPRRVPLRSRADTLRVEGRVRVTLVGSDATNASRGLPVYELGARWGDQWVACRRDSLSWAGEMSQIVWLVDRGRVAGSDGVILDAPAGWRPRFLHTSRPDGVGVDLVHVAAGDPPRALELFAKDAAGHEVTRRVWLRGPTDAERGPRHDRSPVPRPRRTKRGATAAARPTSPVWSFACLPDQRMRVRVSGLPGGLRDARIERGRTRGVPEDAAVATWDGRAWSAVLLVSGTPDPDGFWFKAKDAAGKDVWNRGAFALWPTNSSLASRVDDWASLIVEPGAPYEGAGVAAVRPVPLGRVPAGAEGLRAAVEVLPVSPPLREAAKLSIELPEGVSAERVRVCRRDGDADDWDWLDAAYDSTAHRFEARVTQLGQFALLRDDTAPVVTLLTPPSRPRGTAYSTWSLAARVVDGQSGVAGRACTLAVDGMRVPAEWDAEARVLRWRPLAMPSVGRHEVRVEAVDRVGNRTVRSGAFVITSR